MRVLIFDTETTGLGNPSGAVEIAFIEIDHELSILDARSGLVNPGIPIEPGAQAIHGIDASELQDKPSPEEWMLANWPQDEPVVGIGHNCSFDLRMIGQYIPLLGGQLCTLALARRFISDSKNHKLGTLAAHLQLQTGDAHRAAGDVVTTLSLLRHLLDVSGRTLEQAIAANHKPGILQTMPFGKFKGRPCSQVPQGYWHWLAGLPDLPPDLRLTVRQFKDV